MQHERGPGRAHQVRNVLGRMLRIHKVRNGAYRKSAIQPCKLIGGTKSDIGYVVTSTYPAVAKMVGARPRALSQTGVCQIGTGALWRDGRDSRLTVNSRCVRQDIMRMKRSVANPCNGCIAIVCM